MNERDKEVTEELWSPEALRSRQLHDLGVAIGAFVKQLRDASEDADAESAAPDDKGEPKP